MSFDISVVVTGFGAGRYQFAINRWRHLKIPVNSAVQELDFKNVPAFAVADRCDRARSDSFSRNVRNDQIARVTPNVVLRWTSGDRTRNAAKKNKNSRAQGGTTLKG